ncbi:MAG TPA: LL-diaminopimelate aminotransferase, partial [Chloroflexi bacterium]|nr:LL-diaminopimelate aminotransferase [Chloroflexota bacterium]
MQLAKRMDTVEPYFFAKLGLRIAELKAEGKDVIRLDVGSPDLPPAPFIVDTLQKASSEENLHGYSPLGGTPDFRGAVSTYYSDRFDVNLDPKSEVVGLIGSKEGLFHLSMAYLNPNDVALVPDPGYAVYASAAKFAGAEVVTMPILENNHFLPDLDAIPEDAKRRAKLLWINYPNNPTGATVNDTFFAELVEFAHTHQIMICHDAPYM